METSPSEQIIPHPTCHGDQKTPSGDKTKRLNQKKGSGQLGKVADLIVLELRQSVKPGLSPKSQKLLLRHAHEDESLEIVTENLCFVLYFCLSTQFDFGPYYGTR
ncbi:MAG: hypothetical protein JWM11_4602 [Planctomycetaceae bacterium]|nr:hypothetical protein [Planctomycetaceae bacterium]